MASGAAVGGAASSNSTLAADHGHGRSSISAQEGEFRVFVAGLTWSLTDLEFYEEAKKYGPVENAYVMKHGSGKSRGIGYLNYASRAEMMAALDEIDQAEQARYNQAATAGSGGPWIAGTPLAMSSDQRFDAARETSTDMSSVASIPSWGARPEASAANEGGLENMLSGGHNNERGGINGGGGNMEGGLHRMSSTSTGTRMRIMTNANFF